jgi:prolyl 4-hydroxylase
MCQYTAWLIIFGIIILLAIFYDCTSSKTKSLEKFDSNVKVNALITNSNPINIIDNFISNDECDKLIQMANNRFVTSTVYTTNTGTVDTSARSSSCYYFKRDENELIKSIEDKVASSLNINLNQIEPLQIVKYEKGQQYKYHHDYFGNETDQKLNQRVYSILVYLNDLDEVDGGSTHFPLYKIRTYPYKGRAIGWNNLNPDGKENSLTLHAGEPILSDKVKYVLTIWTRKFNY